MINAVDFLLGKDKSFRRTELLVISGCFMSAGRIEMSAAIELRIILRMD